MKCKLVSPLLLTLSMSVDEFANVDVVVAIDGKVVTFESLLSSFTDTKLTVKESDVLTRASLEYVLNECKTSITDDEFDRIVVAGAMSSPQ